MGINILIQVIVNGLLVGSLYSLISMGLTLIWGTMEIVNFAHGEFLMLGMYMAFFIFTLGKIDPLFSLPLIFVLCFLVGILFYKFFLKKVIYNKTMLSQILLTFGFSVFLKGLALLLWSPNYRLIRGHILTGSINILGINIGIAQLVVSFICILIAYALMYFLNRTRTGRAIKATSINKDAASLVGINVDNIYTFTMGLGISLVGIAGALLANYYYIYPEVGTFFGLLAFVVVAIGGFGSVDGAFKGGLILGIVTSVTGSYISTEFKYAFAFFLYLLVVSINPRGLKGNL